MSCSLIGRGALGFKGRDWEYTIFNMNCHDIWWGVGVWCDFLVKREKVYILIVILFKGGVWWLKMRVWCFLIKTLFKIKICEGFSTLEANFYLSEPFINMSGDFFEIEDELFRLWLIFIDWEVDFWISRWFLIKLGLFLIKLTFLWPDAFWLRPFIFDLGVISKNLNLKALTSPHLHLLK